MTRLRHIPVGSLATSLSPDGPGQSPCPLAYYDSSAVKPPTTLGQKLGSCSRQRHLSILVGEGALDILAVLITSAR